METGTKIELNCDWCEEEITEDNATSFKGCDQCGAGVLCWVCFNMHECEEEDDG